jgi:hypothetical protein
MIVETILFLACVIVAAALIVKVYEWLQDVLYGPYLLSSERGRLHPPRQSRGTAARSLR